MSEMNPPIYIVDDDSSVREAVGSLVRSAGWRAEVFASAQEFLAGRRKDVPSCLVLDVHLPGLSGLDLQQELANSDCEMPIIFLTGQGDIPMAVQAMKAGALEFLTKPVSDEVLLAAIHRGIARQQRGREAGSGAKSGLGQIVGASAALNVVRNQIKIVGPSESTVLILGETGTGKELVAQAIHERSHRSKKPFVKVNCAAIPRDLIASELFGHEKGAYTGALQRHPGRFELAEGGTIFLDEVGDLPAETQIALLRVLQEREFERLGGSQVIRADVRVIAATNRDLRAAIAAGSFRSDLFYRLNVFPIRVPALRERKEDIPLLVEHFLQHYASRAGKNISNVSEDTLELLKSYSWPGNIRELQNVIECSVILCQTEDLAIDESCLAQESVQPSQAYRSIDEKSASERSAIETALAETRGRVAGSSGAAAKLGVPPSTLESKIRSLKINKSRFRMG
jgi:DNA-binding NtrC family response regulator